MEKKELEKEYFNIVNSIDIDIDTTDDYTLMYHYEHDNEEDLIYEMVISLLDLICRLEKYHSQPLPIDESGYIFYRIEILKRLYNMIVYHNGMMDEFKQFYVKNKS